MLDMLEAHTRIMRRAAAGSLALALATVASCHATQLAAVWHDPAARPINFQRTVAIFVTTDPTLRRSVEDRVASKFPNTIPSYRVIAADSGVDRATIVRALSDSGFDGAIVLRLINVQDRVAYAPGAYWYDNAYTFSSYYSMAWTSPYDPGYVSVDRVYTAETEIYSLKSEKLIFGARSETTDPTSIPKLVDSIMRHVTQELRNKQLLY